MSNVKMKKIKALFVSALIALAAGCVSLVSASGIKSKAEEEAKTVLNVGEATYSLDFKMKDGASVRLAADSGLRFSTLLKKSDYETLTATYGAENVKLGTIVLASENAEKLSEITLENAENGGVKYANVVAETEKFKEADGYIDYRVAIHNIRTENLERNYSARSYIAVTNETQTYYAYTHYNETNNSRNASYVANKAFALADKDFSADQLGALDTLINGKKMLDTAGVAVENNAVSNADITVRGTSESPLSIENGYFAAAGEMKAELKNTVRTAKYTVSFTADCAGAISYSVNIYDADGALYDNISTYKYEGSTGGSGEVSFLLETPPVDYSKAVITLKNANGVKIKDIAIRRENSLSIIKKPAKNILSVGETFVTDWLAYGIQGKPAWTSSNATAATIDESGKITAKAAGKTEISAKITANGVAYEDYFELYVTDGDTSKVNLLKEKNLPVDFVLNVPAGRNARILQITDTQLMDMTQIREDVKLSNSQINRWSGEQALQDNCWLYLDKVWASLSEKPDLIVLTGDNTYGKFDDNGKLLDELIEKIESFGVYWTFVFGNHDKESDLGIETILRKYSNAPHCLYAYSGASGDSNMNIAIKQGDEYTKLLYLFDTHSTGANRVDKYALVYAGIYDSQVAWYKDTLLQFKEITGSEEIGQFVFCHIPMNAFDSAIQKYGQKTEQIYINDENGVDFGENHEMFTCYDLDNKVFNEFKSGGVQAIFIGHNHKNNFYIEYEGVGLKYGLKSGTYDEFFEGLVGGTAIEAAKNGYTVKDVCAVNRSVEDFDGAVNFTSNQIKTASMWTETLGGRLEISVTDNTNELPEGGSGKALKAKSVEGGAPDSWSYIFMKGFPLKANKYYKLTFSLKFLQGEKFAYRTKITAGTISGEQIALSGVKQADGLFEFSFRSDRDLSSAGIYYELWNFTKGADYAFTIDNVKLEETEWVATKIENNDGNFELDENENFAVTDGDISLYSPEHVKENWASQTIFTRVTEDGNTKIRVVSNGTHSYDILYIVIDRAVKANVGYKLSFNAKWLGASGGKFGYIVYGGSRSDKLPLSGDFAGTLKNYVEPSQEELFKDGTSISFVATADYDRVYLYLREAEGKQSNSIAFDFKIDNISLVKDPRTADNGTFEGIDGNISVFKPKEVLSGLSGWRQPEMTMVSEDGNTKLLVKNDDGSNWTGMFIRFSTAIEKGKTYAITFDSEWLGDTAALTGWYYAICTDPAGSNYKSNNDLFKQSNTITFTATEDSDYIYLKIINNANKGFNCTFDNIRIEAAD